MKKYLVIYLVCNILASSCLPINEIMSILNFGNLIVHYQEHCKATQNYDFFQFLEQHYSDKNHIASDPSHHKKLPFHHEHKDTCSHFASQMPAFFPIDEVKCFATSINDFVFVKLVIQSPQCHSAQFSGDIWQPPRV
jgi:hypothetical protein